MLENPRLQKTERFEMLTSSDHQNMITETLTLPGIVIESGDHARKDVRSQPPIFFSVRSASPLSLLPGSAQYH